MTVSTPFATKLRAASPICSSVSMGKAVRMASSV
jgi:hypothetical protein